jgi:hypothetical protein
VLYLGRCNLSTFFVKRQHHGDPILKGEVIPRDVKAFPAFIRPDRADARPDLLAVLVFAYSSTVIEDIRWCVRH